MADGTKIEWTDATWNPITGCSVVSPGCTNCYAMRLAGTRMREHHSRKGLTNPSKAGPVWNGQLRFNDLWLDLPLRWGRPRRVFVCAHGDLFHEATEIEWLDLVFAVMALDCLTSAIPHTFQVLTKRPAQAFAYLTDKRAPGRIIQAMNQLRPGPSLVADETALPWPLPNVWLGVSAEDQQRAEERLPILLDTPAAVRWISAEPLLGPIDLRHLQPEGVTEIDALAGTHGVLRPHSGLNRSIDWVVVGGESGPGARPMHPDWPRQILNHCLITGVPFLFKQWGDWRPGEGATPREKGIIIGGNGHARALGGESLYPDDHIMELAGKKVAGRQLAGREWDEMPVARHG